MAKRVLIFYIIFSILFIAFLDKRLIVFIGFTAGSFLGFMQLVSNVSLFERLLTKETPKGAAKKGLIHYLIAILSVLAVLAASISFDLWLFAGIVAGLLLVPVVICVNGITEAVGITHNNFE